VAGVALLTALGFHLERRRETDLVDPTAGVTAEALAAAPDEAPELRFREVASELGVVARHGPGPRGRTLPEDTGSGLAWGDYDGDGDADLYLVNFPGPLGAPSDPEGQNRLFRNDGGRFVDVTESAGVGDLEGFGMGATFADFDGDGDADLHVANYGADRLFENLGDGTFEDAAPELGVADPLWSIAAAWGDYDRDGRLDFYLTHYVDFDPQVAAAAPVDDPNWRGVPFSLNPNAFDPQPNRLYHQLPGGGFEELALPLGASDHGGRSLAATFVDLDGDGWLDLYVANDVSPNALLINLAGELGGEVLFEDRSAATGTADPRGSMGISVADLPIDGEPDGRPDLFVTHWVAQENALYHALEVAPGRLEYRDKVRQLKLAEISTDKVGWGAAFVDLDLDGRLDLAVANGSTLEDDPRDGAAERTLIPQPLFLFWNDGHRFHDLAATAGPALEEPHVARGLAAADFDRDGDVDLAVSANRGRPLLLQNRTAAAGGSLTVELAAPEALARGARVELTAAGRHQRRWWGADVSFASAHAPEMVFGLGSSQRAELSVRWLDGRELHLRSLPAGKRVRVVRPGG
jgi:hypothetical protein